jgi:hypothetical protein
VFASVRRVGVLRRPIQNDKHLGLYIDIMLNSLKVVFRTDLASLVSGMKAE